MITIHLPIHVYFDGKVFLSPDNIELLKKIQTTGSLNAAAKEISVSYQNAWTIIDQINKAAPQPMVIKQRGGSGGGGALISDYGKLILKEYEAIEKEVLKFTSQLNTEINI
jgi:molybdate transport system regulatory protein